MQRLAAALAALSIFSLPFAPTVQAQAYPTKPVRIIVPHPGGGGPLDAPARGLAEHFAKALGQPFVVENRDGADGFIGMEAFVKSPADGYTLLVTSASVVTMNELTRVSLPYNSARDLAPIAYIGALQSLLVAHPSVGAQSLKELIAMAKAKPDTVTWGTLGTTSNGPLLIGLMKKDHGARFYMIPYKSNIQALQGVVAGDVNVTAYAAGGAGGFVKAGKLRALAYTGDTRHPDYPSVPTFTEMGMKLGFRTWIGLFAPAATPRPIVGRLNGEAVKALTDPAIAQKFLVAVGVEPSELSRSSAEQFSQFIRDDRLAYEEAVKAAGIEKR
jgi:tripartite-type tricarboxylate transporter receptor subunit TctC